MLQNPLFFFYNTLNLHIGHLWKCLTLPSNPRLHPPHPKTISPLYAHHPPPSNMRRHRELSTLRPARNAFAVPNPGSKQASGLCNCCLEKSSTRHSNIWVDTFAVQAILVRPSVGFFFLCFYVIYPHCFIIWWCRWELASTWQILLYVLILLWYHLFNILPSLPYPSDIAHWSCTKRWA